MGFALGFILGFTVGLLPPTRGLIYAQWGKARAFAKREGWIK